MSRVDGILFDIDGVLTRDGHALPGAVKTVAALRERSFPFRLVTNTTRKSRRDVARSLAGAGLAVEAPEIMTPVLAARRLLEERNWNGHYLVDPRAVVDLPPEAATEPDAVLVGDLGDDFTVERLNVAFRYLKQGAALIALQKNRYWLTGGLPTLDAGPFVAALEFAGEIEAEVLGKPNAAFFRAAEQELFGGGGGRVALIGDRWETDVEGARAAGFEGILVKTGMYEPGDERRGSPDAILESVGELLPWIDSPRL
ncbi:MAG: HAD hydrolase-like protein [Gemmatimonadetes bacterium]|nr:HAD hydrolase-like protein [Gemmatimonadota bacterium]